MPVPCMLNIFLNSTHVFNQSTVLLIIHFSNLLRAIQQEVGFFCFMSQVSICTCLKKSLSVNFWEECYKQLFTNWGFTYWGGGREAIDWCVSFLFLNNTKKFKFQVNPILRPSMHAQHASYTSSPQLNHNPRIFHILKIQVIQQQRDIFSDQS